MRFHSFLDPSRRISLASPVRSQLVLQEGQPFQHYARGIEGVGERILFAGEALKMGRGALRRPWNPRWIELRLTKGAGSNCASLLLVYYDGPLKNNHKGCLNVGSSVVDYLPPRAFGCPATHFPVQVTSVGLIAGESDFNLALETGYFRYLLQGAVSRLVEHSSESAFASSIHLPCHEGT
jgi:hypothetical protein